MPLFMTHKDSPGHAPAVTTQTAFDKVWSKKGWQLVDEKQAAEIAAAAAAPPTDPAELRGQALEDALTAAGLPVTGNVDEKRAALAAHYESTGA